MEGLNGVIFVEALHYFPFILLNLSASLANIDSAMEEVGAEPRRARLHAVARASCCRWRCRATSPAPRWCSSRCSTTSPRRCCSTSTNMLAPQAYLRVTSVGLGDPMGYVIAVILVGCLGRADGGAALLLRGRDYATQQRGGGGLGRRRGWRKPAGCCSPGPSSCRCCCWCWRRMSASCCSASPPCGRSARCPTPTRWRITPPCSRERRNILTNTLLYCGLAALIDVVLGITIA